MTGAGLLDALGFLAYVFGGLWLAWWLISRPCDESDERREERR